MEKYYGIEGEVFSSTEPLPMFALALSVFEFHPPTRTGMLSPEFRV